MERSGDQQIRPRYLEIRRLLRERVLSGEIASGQRLAGERQLAREFGVSAVTMSRALAELAREGIVVRVPGGGTYVRETSAGVSAVAGVRRHHTILVDTSPIEQPLTNYYMGSVMSGLQEMAVQHACAVRFIESSRTGGLHHLELEADQGLLLLAPLAGRCGEAVALNARLPVVVCGARWPGVSIPTVDTDNVDAAGQVVDYLVRLGHQDIVLVSPPGVRTNTVERLEGYRLAMATHGIPVREDRVIEAASQGEIGEEASRQLDDLMRSPGSPTAVFTTDYSLALECLARLRALGLHIPNDVSVVGFDDSLSAPYLSPPLTTVRQPLQEMGRRAAEMLLDLMEHRTCRCPVEVFRCTLVIRGSCRSTRHA